MQASVLAFRSRLQFNWNSLSVLKVYGSLSYADLLILQVRQYEDKSLTQRLRYLTHDLPVASQSFKHADITSFVVAYSTKPSLSLIDGEAKTLVEFD